MGRKNRRENAVNAGRLTKLYVIK